MERYSPSGEENAAVAWLIERMGALGYARAYADAVGNAVGVLGNGPRQLILLGHIDTVAGQVPIRREGDLYYGRGAVDAKGPLAAFVDAAARLGAVEGWQIIVIGAVGEESDSRGAQYVVPQYHPQAVIIGEPSHWERITLGYKGSAWARLRVSRPCAHSASGLPTACETAAQSWEAVRRGCEAFNTGRPRLFDRLLPTLSGMSSGGNGLEEWAELLVGARLPLDLPPPAWYARLQEFAPLAHIEPILGPVPAYQGDKNSPLTRAFLAAIRQAGGKPGFLLKTGTADLNIVTPAWGCPALAYGPGDSALDHTPNEHVSLVEFAQAVNVLEAVLRTLVQTPDFKPA
ncbi:MAG: [LysW]-lysine hydrolase [Chloroflexi bacterium]|nr:[LysW]-lysine hydrolase [Chloroflexota bacterium]